ncbi:MAG: hypothetical protein COA79_26345 [Planctomycetota bacterium]|nr:MAG: hypothetical protein COA79_26345 [Planctomycetota bacterium]
MDSKSEIISDYQGLIYSTCKRRLDSLNYIEDAVQSVFLLYFESKDLNKQSDLSSWFYWASVNTCKYINKNERKLISTKNEFLKKQDNNKTTEEKKLESEMFLAIENELNTLSKGKFQLILWYYFDKKTHKEIAKIVNSTEDAIRMKLKRLTNQISNTIQSKYKYFALAMLATFFDFTKTQAAINTSSIVVTASSNIKLISLGVKQMVILSKIKATFLLVAFITTIPVTGYLIGSELISSKNNENNTVLMKTEKNEKSSSTKEFKKKSKIPPFLLKKIYADFSNTGLNFALEELSALTGIKIVISKKVHADLDDKTGIKFKKATTLHVALTTLLKPKKLTYKIIKKNEIMIINANKGKEIK